MSKRRVLEVCAGAGGQALGLDMAGFELAGAVEIEPDMCLTLRENRPKWKVIEGDIRDVDGTDFRGVDLLRMDSLGGNLVAKLPQGSRNNGDDGHSFLRLSCRLVLVGVGCFGLFTTLNP